ncbi:DUF2470 domain-containing protein [Mycobacterium haemophilum]|uniref:Prephenate dehydratase n=1 Tax=Mycobacterium haemophilum TaxID=29311 RepID=A0A0I9V249_9MYCO|nr:DUF2470 domain-containing protein [Mycobacterium haemophilum]KLO31186.1 prephenate dehydratase [Mycobacterium haemophilum]KLO36111.1 prephenate dehydratase [Mycobacterium haemophilum]KLO41959.1 prephenate dehydratase [Mycobacterium haemophilum]KLO49869.1 prephenate dehydratase [Mycobacterium haemophilum]
MALVTSPAPTTAERIRSTCARAGGALLALENEANDDPIATPVHHLLHDGSFAVAVPVDPARPRDGASEGQALLELTDYAPLPVREPVRSLVWVRGRLQHVPSAAVTGMLDLIAAEHPNPALLQVDTPISDRYDGEETRYTLMQLEIASVVVTDATGAEAVSVEALLQARPDPFCEIESSLLWHLATAHNDVVARLVARLPASLRRGQVRPLGLDRYGVRFRVEGNAGDRDVRLPFHKPVDDMTGLNQAIRVLLGCPFRNGLRAQR